MGTNVVNRDANPNLYLVPVLQFRMPFVSRGLDTFSSDLDLDSFPQIVFKVDAAHLLLLPPDFWLA